MRHCSESCLKKYSANETRFPVEVFRPPLKMENSALICVLKACKNMETASGIPVDVTVNICLLSGSITAPLVLVHIRKKLSQEFIEFCTEEKLESMLSCFHGTDTISVPEEVLLPALQKFGHSGLKEFLTHCIGDPKYSSLLEQ